MSDLTLAERSVELVRTWIDPRHSRHSRPDKSARRLADLLQDADGLEFTIGFVDRVIRPEDPRVAARNLRLLAGRIPPFLPWTQRALLRTGSFFSRMAPRFVVERARRTLRRVVGHLVVDARPEELGKAIKQLRSGGDRLNLNLLGEAVLGDGEATRRRDGILALMKRDDVDYVSVKVSAIASQLSMWAFEESVARVVDQLRPLYAVAQERGTFVNLDMEEYHDLDLTVAAFTTVLADYPSLEAGIVLQAYLPDALGAMERLQDWAAERRRNGGAPITVRVVKGANLAMERVDAKLHGWPVATWSSKAETDASYKRILRWAMTPERVDAIRLGVAGQNLFDVAYAWLLAGDRGVRDHVQFEMLLGMGTGAVDAVRSEVGGLVLYTPVVDPTEFDAAIAYLVRRLEENASTDNFLSAAFALGDDPALFARESRRFLDAVAMLDDPHPSSHRVQNRQEPSIPSVEVGARFTNTPDTDPAIEENRRWGRRALDRSTYTQIGSATVRDGRVYGPAGLESVIVEARRAGAAWNARGSDVRAWTLHQVGRALESRRADLVTIMAAESGKTIAEADVEVSEAIDFAHYYAESCRRLDVVDGARFEPHRLTVVVPPWNFPVAIPAGMTLAALATGSAVVIKPAPQTPRCAAVMVEALWQAGVPRDVLRFLDVEEGPLSQALITHPQVDQVLLTGGWDTAALFRSWRPGLNLLAETSGKNAMIITPSADLDHAVADLVRSAFGHAGQKCSAASLAILVGSVGTSERFRRQLVDAVRSLRVAFPDDPAALMGPLIEPPGEKLHAGLTELAPGESWLLEPQPLDDSGRLWSPGIRLGVRPNSPFHRTEYFGPVLGLMHAADLEEAIAWQNATDFGLTAGLHTLDPDEVSTWVGSVQAGNLYVNRGITGAIVQRQPFGGWKRSSVGPGAKAGGPNYLARLGTWHRRPLRRTGDETTLSAPVRELIRAAAPHLAEDELRNLVGAACSDQFAWDREFGVAKDVSGLGVERNVFRYLPASVEIRHDDAPLVDLLRVVAAGRRSGARMTVSTPAALTLALLGVEHVVESRERWLARMAEQRPGRIRLVGSSIEELVAAITGDPDVSIYADEVTWSGRVELLPFLLEQAVSVTNHRFGNHDPAFDSLRLTP